MKEYIEKEHVLKTIDALINAVSKTMPEDTELAMESKAIIGHLEMLRLVFETMKADHVSL